MSPSCSPPTSWSISCMAGLIQGYAMVKVRSDTVVPLTPARWRSGRWQHMTAALGTCARTLATFARKQPLGALGSLMLLTMVSLALLAASLAPFDPYEVHVRYKYANPGVVLEETGQRFWLGADQLGRDTLSRLLYGARVSLYVSQVSVGLGVTLGALIGIMSAFMGGVVDLFVQRVVDSLMALPPIVLALAIVALAGVSLRNVVLALIVVLMPAAARLVRAQALSVKEMDYVL